MNQNKCLSDFYNAVKSDARHYFTPGTPVFWLIKILVTMLFREITPTERMKPYVKSFYIYEATSSATFDDIVFPSGNMEVIFNMGDGKWKTKTKGVFNTTPAIELWGQITKPLPVRSEGKNIMLGIRFHPHSAAYFFDEDVSAFNNEVMDGRDVFGASAKTLHARLLGTDKTKNRIALIEDYLLNKLDASGKKNSRIKFVESIASSLKNNSTSERIADVSTRNKISSRYLQQLFSQYTGLSPKLFCKINRFQQSLNLIHSNEQPLTGIGYDSGYFDQSHFIREFKLFTGITPTLFSAQTFPINQMLANN